LGSVSTVEQEIAAPLAEPYKQAEFCRPFGADRYGRYVYQGLAPLAAHPCPVGAQTMAPCAGRSALTAEG